MATVERSDGARELQADLSALRQLLEEGRVEEARRLAPQLAVRWPTSTTAQHYARVLRPPEVIRSPASLRGRSFDREHAWVREHAGEYPGCWLGVFGDELIAADPDLGAVRRAVRAAIGDQMALLHYEPAAQA